MQLLDSAHETFVLTRAVLNPVASELGTGRRRLWL
jgi:hypothetical protein